MEYYNKSKEIEVYSVIDVRTVFVQQYYLR